MIRTQLRNNKIEIYDSSKTFGNFRKIFQYIQNNLNFLNKFLFDSIVEIGQEIITNIFFSFGKKEKKQDYFGYSKNCVNLFLYQCFRNLLSSVQFDF